MSGWYFVKLPMSILDDPTFGQLTDRMFRLATLLRLLAVREDRGGLLPSTDKLAWILRVDDAEDLETELIALEEVGILDRVDGAWHFAAFEEDQRARTPAERKAAQRARERHEPVTKRDTSVTRQRTDKTENRQREEQDDAPKTGASVVVGQSELFNQALAEAKAKGIPEHRQAKYAQGMIDHGYNGNGNHSSSPDPNVCPECFQINSHAPDCSHADVYQPEVPF